MIDCHATLAMTNGDDRLFRPLAGGLAMTNGDDGDDRLPRSARNDKTRLLR